MHKEMGLYDTQLLSSETLYSWIARWGILSGYPDHRSAVSSLLGSDNTQLHSMFPSYISQLSSVLALCPEELIDQHTILPYFRAFKSADNYEMIKNTILNGKTRSIHSKLSLIANRLPQDGFLKFCYLCSREDFMQLGHTFWHVEHQLPFISTCARHNLSLQHLTVARRELLLPTFTQKNSAELCDVNGKAIQLTKLTLDLVSYKNEPLEKTKVRACHLERLKQMGLATQGDSIRMNALRAELKEYWAQALGAINTNILKTLVNTTKGFGFPAPLFYQPNCHHHPAKHLLLIGMLFGDWKSFICAYERTKVNSQKQLVDLHPKNQSNELEDKIVRLIKSEMSMRQVSMLTQTSIGFIKRVAKINSLHVDMRAKKLFEPQKILIVKLAKKGMSTSDIAKQRGCSVGAVEHIISQTKGLVEIRKKVRFLSLRNRHRATISSAIKEYRRRIDIQKAVRASYTWLYKNDKEWLYRSLPPAVPRSKRYLAE
jgi:hypothetical protein